MIQTTMESPVRVFLLLENRLLRESLARQLRRRGEFLVVGECGKEHSCPQELIDSTCHVTVMDFLEEQWLPVNLPSRGEDSCKQNTLLICMTPDFERFFTAIKGGAKGYVLKEAAASEVIAAVRATSRGEAVCPAGLCGELFKHVSRMPTRFIHGSQPLRPDLTLRQQHIVGLVAKGLTNKEIAARLNLSEYTVRNHIYRIMKQFDADTRSHAVESVRSHGYSIHLHETSL